METASPLDSAVMETTTAWIIQMRPVFTVAFVFFSSQEYFVYQSEMENVFHFQKHVLVLCWASSHCHG